MITNYFKKGLIVFNIMLKTEPLQQMLKTNGYSLNLGVILCNR